MSDKTHLLVLARPPRLATEHLYRSGLPARAGADSRDAPASGLEVAVTVLIALPSLAIAAGV